jgi:hypothetical protein
MNTKMNTHSSSRFTLLKAIIPLLVAAALLLPACSSCPEPDQPLPDGTYTATIAVEDMTNIGLPPDNVCESSGTFNLTVTGKNWSFFQTAAPGCVVKTPPGAAPGNSAAMRLRSLKVEAATPTSGPLIAQSSASPGLTIMHPSESSS